MVEKQVIGNATLYHGDCYEVLCDVAGADCMITDPPYGCTCNSWDHDIDLDAFWRLSKAACKKEAAFVIFCQMPFAARLYMSNPKMFRYDLVYPKPVITRFLDARKKPLRSHENVYVFCEKMPSYRPQMRPGEPYRKKRHADCEGYGKAFRTVTTNETGERFPTTIMDVKHENAFYTIKPEFPRHGTQKSVAACSWLVKTYTDEGDLVNDPFMGSGSSGVAAIKQGRKFIGIERDAQWFDVACQRIEKAVWENGLLDYEKCAAK